MDILFASALLEVLAAAFVTIVLIIIAWFMGIDFLPRDIIQASAALAAAILLGLGFGILNGVIAFAVPMWLTVYALCTVALWMTAGVWFVPDALPYELREILSYHPVLQVIEWLRSAYYEGYGSLVLDRSYVVYVGIMSLFFGLLIERMVRGHLLAYR